MRCPEIIFLWWKKCFFVYFPLYGRALGQQGSEHVCTAFSSACELSGWKCFWMMVRQWQVTADEQVHRVRKQSCNSGEGLYWSFWKLGALSALFTFFLFMNNDMFIDPFQKTGQLARTDNVCSSVWVSYFITKGVKQQEALRTIMKWSNRAKTWAHLLPSLPISILVSDECCVSLLLSKPESDHFGSL